MVVEMRKVVLTALFLFFVFSVVSCSPAVQSTAFSGDRALADASAFMAFGPRVTGTEANREAGDWILARLQAAGWTTFTDAGEYMDTTVRNVAARKGDGPIILLGAHYDSRKRADRDSLHPDQPVPGADDGASGVAVLLELARTLQMDLSKQQVWLVFFDAEDNGELDGWDWGVGAAQFARLVAGNRAQGSVFQAMVLLDMVGDNDQQFYLEGNSDPVVQGEIWAVAGRLGYGADFHNELKYTMIDDHIPFKDLGIPAVDIIDFDYPYWHTTADTLDKLSPESLARVGRVLASWLE
jgi:glutaminyl-peptide cyclotransferase